MNLELADKLTTLLYSKQLDQAIELAENELKSIPYTGFHRIIGRDLKHLAMDLTKYINTFNDDTTRVLKRKRRSLKFLFGLNNNVKPAAFYCEMNGFTINYDRWFVDLFAFEKIDLEGWDWLSDFYDSTAANMTITGFEDIQDVFREVHETNKIREHNIMKSYEICELLVILRLQELFKEVYKYGRDEWTKIPMFVTAHDYEMIYRAN
jgi:hypothetical protein